jgi:Spy/CpxP family protein refolding chaperone
MNRNSMKSKRAHTALLAIAAMALVATASVPQWALATQQEEQTAEQTAEQAAEQAAEQELAKAEQLARQMLDRQQVELSELSARQAQTLHENLIRVQERVARASAGHAEALARRLQDVQLHRMQEGELRRVQEGDRRMRVRAAPRIEIRGRSGRMPRRMTQVLAHAEELELTEDQQGTIRAMERENRRAGIERRAAIEVAELDLEDLMESVDDADLAAVEAKMLEISRLEVQGEIAQLRMQQQVHGVLTAEQRSQLDEMSSNVFIFRGGGNDFSWQGSGDHEMFFAPEGNMFFPGPDGDVLFEFEEGEGDGANFFIRKKKEEAKKKEKEGEQEGEQISSPTTVNVPRAGVQTL